MYIRSGFWAFTSILIGGKLVWIHPSKLYRDIETHFSNSSRIGWDDLSWRKVLDMTQLKKQNYDHEAGLSKSDSSMSK